MEPRATELLLRFTDGPGGIPGGGYARIVAPALAAIIPILDMALHAPSDAEYVISQPGARFELVISEARTNSPLEVLLQIVSVAADGVVDLINSEGGAAIERVVTIVGTLIGLGILQKAGETLRHFPAEAWALILRSHEARRAMSDLANKIQRSGTVELEYDKEKYEFDRQRIEYALKVLAPTPPSPPSQVLEIEVERLESTGPATGVIAVVGEERSPVPIIDRDFTKLAETDLAQFSGCRLYCDVQVFRRKTWVIHVVHAYQRFGDEDWTFIRGLGTGRGAPPSVA